MEPLSEKQVNIINDRLVNDGLTDDVIRLDLIDHVCTLTELFMEKGQSFEIASKMAFAEFKPKEFEQIQELSLYYINLKQNRMKKAVGILGIIASVMLLVGVFFKLQYWPGAAAVLVIALTFTGVIVLPLLAYTSYSKTNSTQTNFTYLAGYLSVAICTVAAMFVIMHWPGARVISIFGLTMLCLVFMPLYAIRSYKTSENKILGLSKSFLIFAGILLFWGLAQKPRPKANEMPQAQQTSTVQN